MVAEFGRAHGVRGEVRLKSWTADPASVRDYGPFVSADGRPLRLTSLRPAPGGEADMFIVQVEGVGDRSAAEALARQRLFVPRDRLPQLDDEDEFYLADLVGLAVENDGGRQIGEVIAVHDFGAGDVIEIRPLAATGEKRGSVMVAFTRDFVPVVDIAGRRVVVTPDPFLSDGQDSGDEGPDDEGPDDRSPRGPAGDGIAS
ncbi:ribosome maturation factor RimM [Camelimonas fluminis]|nr:ribosome maturation factor RimM [Camelimonas fluminis]